MRLDRRVAFAVAVFAATAGATLTVAAAAGAATPDCRTVTTHLADHPDGGHHGTWAVDTFARTVTVCQTSLREYHATVSDSGTFTTIPAALSPRQGVALPAAAIVGTLRGGFTADFAAGADWVGWDPSAVAGVTLTGQASTVPSTSLWVKALWSTGFAGVSINDDWSWTYRTCNEQWTDAVGNNDGQDVAAGDITGSRPCRPHRSPCPSPSVHGSPTPSASASTSPSAAPSRTPIPAPSLTLAAGTGNLPKTGPDVVPWIGLAAGAILAGVGLIVLFRRRTVTS